MTTRSTSPWKARLPRLVLHMFLGLLLIQGLVYGQDPAAVPPPVSAPAPGTSPVHPVYLKFTSSASGAALKPSSILINGTPTNFAIEAASLVVLNLPEGRHRLEIQAEGFNPLESSITVSSGATPVMGFELDPNAPEDAPAVAEGSAVVEGHVTDADTGELLKGVEVTIPDSGLTTTTDGAGQYEFELRVPETRDTAQPVITLEARATDYVPLRIKHLTLAAGQRRRTPLALERQTSDTTNIEFREIDEAAEAGSHRSFEWVFDATIR